ncbi:MAG: hypothetical protein IIU77_03590 [Clostridia bacterium]|nr:hypothetical protein [Clostridia bacterium]
MITKEEMITLRKAREEIEDQYRKAKCEALNGAIDKMCETKQGYTSLQISADTGLSVPCVASTLRRDNTVGYRIERKKIRMVALDEDGVPNMSQIFTRKKRQAFWYVREGSWRMMEYNKKHKPATPEEDTETNPSSIGGAMVKAMIKKYGG